MAPSPWTDAADRKLLLIIIQILSPSPPKWDEVAAKMGDGFTAEAVRQHYQKMRKEVSPAGSTEKGTPRGGKTTKKTTSANKKRKGRATSDSPASGDDGDEESPSKKAAVLF